MISNTTARENPFTLTYQNTLEFSDTQRNNLALKTANEAFLALKKNIELHYTNNSTKLYLEELTRLKYYHWCRTSTPECDIKSIELIEPLNNNEYYYIKLKEIDSTEVFKVKDSILSRFAIRASIIKNLHGNRVEHYFHLIDSNSYYNQNRNSFWNNYQTNNKLKDALEYYKIAHEVMANIVVDIENGKGSCLPKVERIIELGAGAGELAELILDRTKVRKYVLIENNDVLAATAKSRLSRFNERARIGISSDPEIIVANATNLHKFDTPFDIAIASGFLNEYVLSTKKATKAVQNLAHNLKDNSILLLCGWTTFHIPIPIWNNAVIEIDENNCAVFTCLNYTFPYLKEIMSKNLAVDVNLREMQIIRMNIRPKHSIYYNRRMKKLSRFRKRVFQNESKLYSSLLSFLELRYLENKKEADSYRPFPLEKTIFEHVCPKPRRFARFTKALNHRPTNISVPPETNHFQAPSDMLEQFSPVVLEGNKPNENQKISAPTIHENPIITDENAPPSPDASFCLLTQGEYGDYSHLTLPGNL